MALRNLVVSNIKEQEVGRGLSERAPPPLQEQEVGRAFFHHLRVSRSHGMELALLFLLLACSGKILQTKYFATFNLK